MLGLRFCARAFSSCGKRGPLFITVRRPLTVVASLVAEHRLQMHRLSSCGSRAQPLRGMWDLPRPGLEPVSPALAGGLPTTAPPGKPRQNLFLIWFVAFIFSIWIINSLHIYRSHLFHQKLLIEVFIRHVLKFQLMVNFRAKSFGDVLIAYGKYMRPIESTYIDLLILCLISRPFLQVCFINSQFHLLLLFFLQLLNRHTIVIFRK